jgi:pyruvate/2-oxoglutarate dehydrogenase complex dihydrolipoamide acyltransferase (E2) component
VEASVDAPVGGTLVRCVVAEGVVVKVGDIVAVIDET